MDTGVPPSDKRPRTRPPGAAKSRATQPTDPRHEGSPQPVAERSRPAKAAPSTTGGSTSNGSSTSNGEGNGEGNRASRTQPSRDESRKSVPVGERTHSTSTAEQPGDAAVAMAGLPLLEAPPGPLFLPPIVWARAAELDAAEGARTAHSTAGGNGRGETALVPSVKVPVGTSTDMLPALTPSPDAEFTDADGTDGLPSLLRPRRATRTLRAPVVRPRRRPRVRRVTRVIRHVDTWSVFKVALVFNLFLYGVCLTAGVLLWQVAQNTGTVDNIERFFESFGWERFDLKGGEIYHNAWIAGLFVVVGLTGLAVLTATLFNLITDLVGGVRVTVLEEEVIARDDRGLGWRRGLRTKPAVEPVVADVANPVE